MSIFIPLAQLPYGVISRIWELYRKDTIFNNYLIAINGGIRKGEISVLVAPSRGVVSNASFNKWVKENYPYELHADEKNKYDGIMFPNLFTYQTFLLVWS